MKKIVFLLLFLVALPACYKEEVVFNALPNEELELPLILAFDGKDCFLDYEFNSLRYSIENDSIVHFSPFVEFQDYSDITFNHIPLVNHSINDLGTIKINKKYPLKITTRGTSYSFTLSFTNLPLVRIVTHNKIMDEPQKLARITIHYPASSKASSNSFIGIDFRGGAAQFVPKKSYGFSCLNSMSLANKSSKVFFENKQNEDWILDAMFHDKSRLRNKVSFEIWKEMDSLTHSSIQSQFVELYLNNDAKGIYGFNEQINAEQLHLSDIDAVLYKATAWGDGATTFNFLTSNLPTNIDIWDGWEQKYPRPKDRINWHPLFDLRNLVVNGSDADFLAEIENHIQLDIFIDYYIFLNLIAGFDNYGKNIFWTKDKANAPFLIIPWDMDGTWGQFWDGTPANYDVILGNTLYDRLLALSPNNYTTRLKNRWFALRGNTLMQSNLEAKFAAHFAKLQQSDIIELENKIWGLHLDSTQEENYLNNWILGRLSYLDTYFANL